MFAQVIQGRTSDENAVRAASDRWMEELAPGAVGWLEHRPERSSSPQRPGGLVDRGGLASDLAQPWVPVAVVSWSANLRRASSSALTAFSRRSQPRVSADLSGARAS